VLLQVPVDEAGWSRLVEDTVDVPEAKWCILIMVGVQPLAEARPGR
jgi:hypothetical protein